MCQSLHHLTCRRLPISSIPSSGARYWISSEVSRPSCSNSRIQATLIRVRRCARCLDLRRRRRFVGGGWCSPCSGTLQMAPDVVLVHGQAAIEEKLTPELDSCGTRRIVDRMLDGREPKRRGRCVLLSQHKSRPNHGTRHPFAKGFPKPRTWKPGRPARHRQQAASARDLSALCNGQKKHTRCLRP